MNNLLIIGAGGHGKVVADAVIASGQWHTIAFVDQCYPDIKQCVGLPVVGNDQQLGSLINDFPNVIVAIGNNSKRVALLNQCEQLGFTVATIIHPRACVSDFAQIDVGVVVFAGAVINADARVAKGAIINTGAIVEHDCVIGAGVHVCPNVALAGNVTIGQCSWIGIGSNIIQNCCIGEDVTIGAGSVVINNTGSNKTVVGVPARDIRSKEELC